MTRHQRVANLMQQHRSEERRDVQRRHGARLAAAHPDENQEHQQQDEGEVQAHRHAKQSDGANSAGSVFRFSLLWIRHVRYLIFSWHGGSRAYR